ncbi:TonB-dependent receptor [Oscillospiraceae bacterium N12]|jgi:outer membrane receptor protein involved in Fe transport|uniref:TonB-dependent receptor n=1 Tax=Jilunia laotingensis TaxID=2763675 RepID=A0A926F2H7_9BACT|nr:TonB-dependent receptor [Jilunia laotingensis]MBC8592176.1 TonB-dependent receptor [Jilunia laotingensis]
MKRKSILIALALMSIGSTQAEDVRKDTIKVIDVEEVIVIASPKENRKLRELPTASTLLSQKDMQANQVTNLKGLSAVVPNIFIPDYGSKLTSAIYIRGIGSRINTPSVGLYVDNIPYINQSAFDFNYSDIERIDVLRGPQGTLYGRNTMGGLIRVHTKSPFSYQGTDIRLGAATYGNYNASLTHYHRLSDQLAFSAGGFYEHADGFFKNSWLNNKKIDRINAGGGRLRSIYLPSENLKLDFNVNYEYSDQGGYPYFYTGKVDEADREKDERKDKIGLISYNDESSYYRNLLNASVNIEYQATNFTLSAVTGYQHLKDRMFLDQDFTEEDIFNLEQKQKLNTISEEIVLKSKPGRRWEWATGAFGFYQWLHTSGPVMFKERGIQSMLEDEINNHIPDMGKMGQMSVDITTSPLWVSGSFDTPIVNGALFHQSTFHDLLVKGLSLTIGLRLDYEKNSMTYSSRSDINYNFNMNSVMIKDPISQALSLAPAFNGKLDNDYLQLLPKFALQYEWKKGNSVYGTVSRGYRSGGYNVQMFSDLIKSSMRNGMQGQIKESLTEIFSHMQGMPPSVIDKILANIPGAGPEPDVAAATTFKPEYTWNYEVGAHLTLFDNRLFADMAAFYMDTRNQQVAKFAESGLGRVTVNAGKSRSYGAEIALRAAITDAFSLNANYGYTYATFREYAVDKNTNYKGNYVPFVPKHTLNAGAQYIFRIAPRHWLDRVQLNANYNAAGRIYWTEANNASQSFYGTLNGRVSLEKGNGAIAFWIRNALDKKYEAFYFESMGNGFMQKGRPMQLGIEVRCRF